MEVSPHATRIRLTNRWCSPCSLAVKPQWRSATRPTTSAWRPRRTAAGQRERRIQNDALRRSRGKRSAVAGRSTNRGRRRRALHLHAHKGVAARSARAAKRKARTGPTRSSGRRTDSCWGGPITSASTSRLVRLARRREAPAGAAAEPGRRMADRRGQYRKRSASNDEASRLGRTRDRQCSSAGDVVLDLFLGSGSTMIAGERTGRVCFGTELDEHYASVVIARWEASPAKPLENSRKRVDFVLDRSESCRRTEKGV